MRMVTLVELCALAVIVQFGTGIFCDSQINIQIIHNMHIIAAYDAPHANPFLEKLEIPCLSKQV